MFYFAVFSIQGDDDFIIVKLLITDTDNVHTLKFDNMSIRPKIFKLTTQIKPMNVNLVCFMS